MWNLLKTPASKRAVDIALHRAIVNDDAMALQDALKASAEPLAKNKYGYSALEMARLLGRDELVAVLSSPTQRYIKFQGADDDFPSRITISQFEQVTGVKYYSHLRCDTPRTFGRVIRHCPWLQKYTAWGKEQRWLGKWHAKDRQEGYVADVSVRWIDDTVGYGVFAERDLPALTFVGQYTGILRQWYMTKGNHNAYCFHYPTPLWKLRTFMIDAMDGGNETRFVNHGDAPNCEPAIQLDRGLLHVFFRTTKTVAYGDQLLLDYGKDYWLRRSKRALTTEG